MTIEQILLLEPDLKSSIRKYQAIGKTGLLNGKTCSYERLMLEIAETVKCYCSWSKHEILQGGETKEFLTGYLLSLCPNIKSDKITVATGMNEQKAQTFTVFPAPASPFAEATINEPIIAYGWEYIAT